MATNKNIAIVPPDRGWAWIVLMASFCCCVIIGGILGNIPICLTTFLRHKFKLEWSESIFYFVLQHSAYIITTPLASALLNRFGFRLTAICGATFAGIIIGITYFIKSSWLLIMIYGLLGNFNLSLLYIPAVTIIGFYFEKWRGLATGLTICGLEVGRLVFPLLYRNIAWDLSLVLQGFFIFACAFFALAFRPLKPTMLSASELNEIESTSDKPDAALQKRLPSGRVAHIMPRYAKTEHQYAHSQKGIHLLSERLRHPHSSMLDLSLLRSPKFALLALSGTLYAMGLLAPSAYLMDDVTANGINYQAGAKVASVISAVSLAGTFLCGIFVSFPKMKALWLSNIIITLAGISALVIGRKVMKVPQWTFAFYLGLSFGCFKGLRPLIAVDVFGLEKLPDAYGLLLLFEGFGILLFAFVNEFVLDLAGNYMLSFYFASGLIFLSAVMSYPVNYVASWESA